MAIYSSEDYERIAVAISQNVADILEHKVLFEWAADWYGLDCGLPRDAPRRPRRMPPSKMDDKLQRLGFLHYIQLYIRLQRCSKFRPRGGRRRPRRSFPCGCKTDTRSREVENFLLSTKKARPGKTPSRRDFTILRLHPRKKIPRGGESAP